jgi:hypothetical protein
LSRLAGRITGAKTSSGDYLLISIGDVKKAENDVSPKEVGSLFETNLPKKGDSLLEAHLDPTGLIHAKFQDVIVFWSRGGCDPLRRHMDRCVPKLSMTA